MSYEEVGGDLSIMISSPFRSVLEWAGWWGSNEWNFARVLPDVSATFAEEGSPAPLFFGRWRLRNPNVTWYGNLVGINTGEEDYYYEMNVMMVFGIPMGTDHDQNPGTIVRRIWWDDAKCWPYPTDNIPLVGNWTAGTQAFGKAMIPVGAGGDVNFHGGSFEQGIDGTMYNHFESAPSLDGDYLPNYRGFAYAYFHGNGNTYSDGYRWGSSADLPQMSWELEAITHPLGMSDINSEGDANRPR